MTAPAHLAHLVAFKMNDMNPFSGGAADIAHESLAQAHALSLMIGSAFRDSEETATTNGTIIDAAISGIGTLIALAQFAHHGGDA